MKFSTIFSLSLAGSAAAFAPSKSSAVSKTALSETKADLEALAAKCNPLVNFYDPIGLADADFWGQGNEATIGFLRHAEIKHGRVAMAAFVGYCIHANVHFGWPQTLAGAMPPSTDLAPEAQWDAIPTAAKWQIFAVISALEMWDESGGGAMPHYMAGRQPGKYPSFAGFRDTVHPVLDLYDPFGFSKGMSEEKKENRLVMEINNGRLAMIGIMGFLAADRVEGSVPALSSIARSYDGDVMQPFKEFSYFN